MRQQAVWAAVVTCVEVLGKAPAKPTVLQDSNNVVVDLAPCPVVAKVGRHPWSAEALDREVRVARHLAGAGVPVAAPLADLVVEPGTGRPVSLWERLAVTGERPAPADVATAVRAVHDGLATFPDPLPGWLDAHELARAALADDEVMAALPIEDLTLLRSAYAAWTADAAELDPATFRALHGEPHDGNVVATAGGVVVVDFEAASIGPVESDLACLAPAVIEAGAFVADPEVLALCADLRSAYVATWCWASDHPDLRAHAGHHLDVVRRRYCDAMAASASAAGSRSGSPLTSTSTRSSTPVKAKEPR